MKNSTAPSRFEQGAMACTSGPITVRIIVNDNCGWGRLETDHDHDRAVYTADTF
jgi:hypothetical protein